MLHWYKSNTLLSGYPSASEDVLLYVGTAGRCQTTSQYSNVPTVCICHRMLCTKHSLSINIMSGMLISVFLLSYFNSLLPVHNCNSIDSQKWAASDYQPHTGTAMRHCRCMGWKTNDIHSQNRYGILFYKVSFIIIHLWLLITERWPTGDNTPHS